MEPCSLNLWVSCEGFAGKKSLHCCFLLFVPILSMHYPPYLPCHASVVV